MAEQQFAQWLRVEKGNPSAEDLAALTAVLLARTAAVGAEPDDVSRRERAKAHWRRPERGTDRTEPRSWCCAPLNDRDRARPEAA
ncbi:acyl-CoA carboxylase epsilon subunit [Streptomyces sp. TRM 70351]|uniref:acyl-CoA carboxylase epsilon subunit n=1 Tax=Streptomyces sp. TRM 70351 TaxID=3116552 RepID=UPI002E7BEC22|nr:acyl-CoA carboxylase epsilon subunit [Streptomyces sp. TRM 70351]MEE1931544.1 acyl-CoA carboxylase epsilon subunit [Streptomyces sp. TRM 70351]